MFSSKIKLRNYDGEAKKKRNDATLLTKTGFMTVLPNFVTTIRIRKCFMYPGW